MIKVGAVFLMCIIYTHQIFAGFERSDAGARVVALGSAFVGMADDSWAVFYNPAGLSRGRLPEISAFYSPQPFGLNELRSVAFVAFYPTSFGALGASVRSFGFSLYKETSVGVSYANEIGGILVGTTLNYHSVSISRYGSAGTLGIDVGILVPVFQNLGWGIATKNINAPKIGEAREKLPQTFTAGISYQPLSSLSFVLDYAKEIGFAAGPRFGLEYWIVDAIALRTGVASEPSSYALGLGFRYSFIQLDYVFTTHRELGLTHQASITLQWISDDQ